MKIVILTFDLPEANVVTRALLREPGGAVRGIVASTSMITGISNRAAIVRLGRALGWRARPAFPWSTESIRPGSAAVRDDCVQETALNALQDRIAAHREQTISGQ